MSIIDPPMVDKLMLVPEQNTFIGAQPGSALVIHKTASGGTAEGIANFFIHDPNGASSHFVVGQDGEIVQCVPLINGAGANCCVETGFDPYWQQFNPMHVGSSTGTNLNTITISIEHVDPATDNSTPLTDAQKASSFKLVKWLVDQYGFNITPDGHGQMVDIKGHNTIDPINRARCPGNYPWSELITYLQGGTATMGTPAGWKDDGTTLTAPNGKKVVHGFRDYVLNHNWDAANWPVDAEFGASLLESSNPSLGGGSQQLFRWTMLGYTATRGVFVEWVGQELAFCRQQVQRYAAQIAQLQAELAAAQQPTGVDPAKVKDRLTAIGLAANNGNTAIQQLVNQPL
jgi:N-acetyl-anhydromuramyl-L-alanine amidase AmpD